VRRAIIINYGKGQSGQSFGMLTGVSDSSRAKDELRVGIIEITQTAQATQYPGEMGAKNTTIGMGLIYYHIPQAAQQSRPGLMIGQYTDMEHVRVGKYYPGSFPYLSPLSLWRIAIKGGKFLHPE